MYIRNILASVTVLVLVAGATQTAYAESITACEQTVNYTVIPPATDVAEPAHAFSGVWIGNWGGGQLCHVLIVEDVKKDGSVSAKYVYGTNPGWGLRQPGVRQWTGKISGNTLMLRGNNLSVDYVMSGDGTLAATYTQNNQQTAVMKRK
jgi:hypothetical protein